MSPRCRRRDHKRLGTWRKHNQIRGRVQAADHHQPKEDDMGKETTWSYIKPADPEMFRLGKLELKVIAEGRPSKKTAAAQAELARRAANKAGKRS